MLGHNNHRGKSGDITCTVGTCAYHGGNNTCQANGVKIGTEYALDKTETFCSTYAHKTQ